jgi:hypothetical protein
LEEGVLQIHELLLGSTRVTPQPDAAGVANARKVAETMLIDQGSEPKSRARRDWSLEKLA